MLLAMNNLVMICEIAEGGKPNLNHESGFYTKMGISNATLKTFADYVSRELAQHGFTLISPQLAERRAPGMRQGILLRSDVVANVVWTQVSTYSTLTHELDDGPTGERLTTVGVVAGVASGSMGSLGDDDLASTLEMVRELLLPNLLRYGAVEAVVREVERYPGSASRFIGSSPIAATFNLAHCLETIGRLSDAKALYLETAERLEPSNDVLARAYADAARRRVEALHRADVKAGNSAKSGDVTRNAPDELELSDADEALRPFYVGLLRYLESAGENPTTSYPSLLFRAMDELYEPEARPGFWRSVSSSTVMSVVKMYAPDFERQMTVLSPTKLARYVEDLELGLQMRVFDEACAERLLALTQGARPETREDVYEWLLTDFDRRGEEDKSDYLERDGLKGADAVIAAMALLSNGTRTS